MKTDPFFIIGCVRSGTTLLRDVLRRHPDLAAPEETHFYRWAEAFGGVIYKKTVTENSVLKRHREMDGISEPEFQELLESSVSRADLCRRYMGLYLKRNKPGARRWFDKTPQNVYGAALIASEMPAAQFIHIVRHPFDVVASLRIGKVIKVQSLVAACSYWNEAAGIIHVLKKAYPQRVHEVRYEDFTREPMPELGKILAFLGEDFDPAHFSGMAVSPMRHDHDALFTAEERDSIVRHCLRWGAKYGYFTADALLGEMTVFAPLL